MLIALSTPDDEPINADDVTPDMRNATSYRCPACGGPVRYREGARMTPHFYHLGRPPGCPQSGETERHQDMKRALARDIYAHRADLVVTMPNGFAFMIECQHSALSAREWETRTRDYATAGHTKGLSRN